jgi:hypothetical protein
MSRILGIVAFVIALSAVRASAQDGRARFGSREEDKEAALKNSLLSKRLQEQEFRLEHERLQGERLKLDKPFISLLGEWLFGNGHWRVTLPVMVVMALLGWLGEILNPTTARPRPKYPFAAPNASPQTPGKTPADHPSLHQSPQPTPPRGSPDRQVHTVGGVFEGLPVYPAHNARRASITTDPTRHI